MIDLWKFGAGLGLFITAMNMLETSLRQLGTKTLRNFLERLTNSTWKSFLGGIVATTVLQSSSIVTLMVLAFVGSGLIPMQNALGIIFGSNIGTTFTGWMVTLLGFKVDIETLALPLLALAGLIHIFSYGTKRLTQVSLIFAALGLLFIGLDFMKDSMAAVANSSQSLVLAQYPSFYYFIFGFIVTAIIQSSSAMMVVVLTALNAQALSLFDAAAIVLGADLGTTITTVLGAVGGSSARKQIALAHVLFNVVTDSIAYLTLPLLMG
ncbi:MAG: Na/Pi cotransporter family protein, partial [Bdellovibrionales bacterium]|nr:Na/Pi cotransporter family protein [Bdellovibrionales bacterium]